MIELPVDPFAQERARLDLEAEIRRLGASPSVPSELKRGGRPPAVPEAEQAIIATSAKTAAELAELFGVSQDTVYRYRREYRARTGRTTPRSRQGKLTERQAAEVAADPRPAPTVAREYGISERAVYYHREKRKKVNDNG